MKKYLFILIMLIFYLNKIASQITNPPQSFPSPNATSFGIYGDIPVSLFTGIPQIEIPLYTIKCKGLEIPITMNYHIASVRFNCHPGWVGLGWDLRVGGVITREQRGIIDEFQTDAGLKPGYYDNYNKLNISDWSSAAKIKTFSADRQNGFDAYEVEADIFNFSFLGYSGKFILSHEGVWEVISDQPIKVKLVETIPRNQLRSEIRSKVPGSSGNRFFNKFTLIAGDGTEFEFGGVTATEYSTSYRDQLISSLIPTSWFLSKIKTPNGETVDFTYNIGKLICSLNRTYSYLSYNKPGGGWFSWNKGCSGTAYNFGKVPASGYLIFPVYLRSISTSNEDIYFDRSVSTEMKYDNFDRNFGYGLEPGSATTERDFFYYLRDLDQLQWEKLDNIKSKSKTTQQINKEISFEYTSSENERLKLLKLQISGENPYSFLYNDLKMSVYCSDQFDHWGFYNGFDVSTFHPNSISEWLDQFPTTREPDITGDFLRAETLSKITYPTGGYSQFVFEPNKYGQCVDTNRTSLIPYTTDKTGGGLRFRKIITSANGGSTPVERNYYYVNGFTGVEDPTQLRSSGILGGLSEYKWFGYQGKDLANNNFYYDVFYSGSLLPYGFNTEGSPIGYSEVVELISGNGFNKYSFSNFDNDIYGVPHMDQQALEWIDADRSVYSPFTSRSIERGKLLTEKFYSAQNHILKKIDYQYDKSSDNFLRMIKTDYLNICAGVNATAQNYYGTAYKLYSYNFNLLSRTTSDYDMNGENPVTRIDNFSYNSNNLLSSHTQIQSDGSDLKVTYKYPGEFLGNLVLKSMAMPFRNMLNYPIETVNYKNGKVIGSKITSYLCKDCNYNPANGGILTDGVIVPSEIFGLEADRSLIDYQELSSTLTTDSRCKSKVVYDNYDNKGNLLQFHNPDNINTSYIWSYNQTYPVAKFDNIAYSTVSENSTLLNYINQLQNYTELSDPAVRSNLKTLNDNIRSNVPANVMVSTYTYKPLVGITSQTDPDGNTTYYEYDSFGRLHRVLDRDKNVLKEYEYHYQYLNP
jgi:YD repeat-containing protein